MTFKDVLLFTVKNYIEQIKEQEMLNKNDWTDPRELMTQEEIINEAVSQGLRQLDKLVG